MDADLLADQVRLCAACPKMCRHVCPTFFAWRSDSPTPHGRALLIHQDLQGVRPLDARAIEVLYQCLECSHCLTWCLPQVDIAEIVETVRNKIVMDTRQPSELNGLRDSIEKEHNPFEEPHERRLEWRNDSSNNGKKIFFFVGCTTAYREPSIGISAVEVLSDLLGYDVITSDEEWCCGSPLFRTGFQEEASKQAEHNVEFLNQLDVEMIVVTCPGCYRALTTDYSKHGLELTKPVVHISTFLNEHLDKIPVCQFDESISYHDPCHLGRHSGIYDEPRNVINKVSNNQLVEMERNREDAMCCGNGAGLRTLFKDASKKIGRERLVQAQRTGADYLVTACPFCKNLLAGESADDIQVVDLPELISLAMKLAKRPIGEE